MKRSIGKLSSRILVLILFLVGFLFQGSDIVFASSGTWTTTGSMNTARHTHAIIRLVDGRVLVAGGTNGSTDLSSAEIYDPDTGIWTSTGSMYYPRKDFTVTLLPNNNVLVAGGWSGSGTTSTAELFDPVTGLWSITGSLNQTRFSHKAVLLNNGKVLLVGGHNGTVRLSSVEVYDPVTGLWTLASPMHVDRAQPTATLLSNGKVLVVGGESSSGYLASAEIYDPDTDTWTLTPVMNYTHCYHSANLLKDGRVLIAGNPCGEGTSEIYDSILNTWTVTGSKNGDGRNGIDALLPDGTVLVAGGNICGGPSAISTSKIYDPGTGLWSVTSSMNVARSNIEGISLSDGRVLVAGGYPLTSTAEIYTIPNPTVSVEQSASQVDPVDISPIEFAVVFSELITGFDVSDVDFTGSTTSGSLVASISGTGPSYTVSVSGMTSDGVVTISIPAGVVTDSEGNPNIASSSDDNSVTFNYGPSVTIDQSSSQQDPSNSLPIEFIATFSEIVFGFDENDVSFSGSTAPGTYEISIIGSGPEYVIAIQGITGDGIVEVSIPSNSVVNIDGDQNSTSINLDSSVYFDITPPDTSILTHPANPSNNPSPSFTFSSPDGTAGFECALDNGSYASCTSPKNLSGLSEGSHTFNVRAVDAAGNVDATPASYIWMQDYTSPNTVIVTHPGNATNSTSASFTFSSPDGTAVFQCALDSGAYAACSSPKELTGLTEGSHMFYIRAVDPAGNIDVTPATFTWFIDLTPPAAPILSLPNDSAIFTISQLEFSWSSVAGGDHYRIQISITPSFDSSIVDVELSDGILAYSSTPLDDGYYYWHVAAYDEVGNRSQWSISRTFTIDTTPPLAPTLISPAAGAAVRGTPTYSWNASVTATVYIFEYDNNSDFSSPTYTSGLLTSTSKKPPLQAVGTFYWHVKARDGAGNWSDWSSKRKVTIKPVIPVAPKLVSPLLNANVNDPTPTLTWKSVPYGSRYQIQIISSDLKTIEQDKVLNPGILKYTATLLKDGKHYWRVRAINVLNENGAWSSARAIIIDTIAPAAPILSSPTNGEGVLHTPTYSWKAVVGGKYYQFSYSKSPTFTNVLYTSGKLTSLNITPPTQQPGTYYWRVRAQDAAGNWSNWSIIWKVIIY